MGPINSNPSSSCPIEQDQRSGFNQTRPLPIQKYTHKQIKQNTSSPTPTSISHFSFSAVVKNSHSGLHFVQVRFTENHLVFSPEFVPQSFKFHSLVLCCFQSFFWVLKITWPNAALLNQNRIVYRLGFFNFCSAVSIQSGKVVLLSRNPIPKVNSFPLFGKLLLLGFQPFWLLMMGLFFNFSFSFFFFLGLKKMIWFSSLFFNFFLRVGRLFEMPEMGGDFSVSFWGWDDFSIHVSLFSSVENGIITLRLLFEVLEMELLFEFWLVMMELIFNFFFPFHFLFHFFFPEDGDFSKCWRWNDDSTDSFWEWNHFSTVCFKC